MKKVFKIIGGTFLVLLILLIGFGVYMYQTDPMLKAIMDNDETKLYYFPVKKLENLSGLNYEEIPLKVEDSISIYAYDFKPKTKTIAGNIFLVHGAGGNVSRYKDLIEPLLENGFRVYAFDWRGYGKSNGIPTHKNVLADSQLAFADFYNKTKNDSSKTIIYGMSLGGQLAVKLAKENEDKIDALVMDGSIESIQGLAIDHAPIEYLKEKAKNNPQDFNQEYVALNDIKEIQKTPKLIIHSVDDKEVIFSRGQNLFKNAKEPKTFWKTKGEHIMTLKNYPKETIQKIKELMD